jgi:hypothetical protein
MLEKSKTSAFVMGCIYIMSAIFGSVAMEAFSNPNKGLAEIIYDPNLSNQPVSAKILSWGILLLVVIITGGILTWPINKFDETHFGISGVILWAVSGIVYAVWIRFIVFGLPKLGVHISKVTESILELIGLGISYGIVFRLFRNVGRSKDKSRTTIHRR